MRKTFALIYISASFLFQCSASNPTSFFVDKSASGRNNGNSWENAWESFSEINWRSIDPGDTIFISGGADSLIYSEELSIGASGTVTKPIFIIAGKYAAQNSNHSGRVIIDGGLTRSQSIYVQNDNYVTIKGFELRHATKGVHVEDYASNIILDSLNIYDYLGQAGVMVNAASEYTIDNVTIKNCRIISFNNYPGQTDGIYVQRAQQTVIHNNYIRIPNQDPVAHNDAIQAHLANGFTIYNNIIINDSVYSQEGGGIPIILGAQGNYPVIIYNNFIYMGGIWWPNGNIGAALCTRWYDTDPMPPTWIIHNTIVVNGPRCRGVWQQYPATMINNIIAMFSTTEGMESFNVYDLPSAAIVDSIRKNLFWRSWAGPAFSGQYTGNGLTGNVFEWIDWVNTYGGTGVYTDPLFVRHIGFEPNQGTLNGELQPDSPAINQGENVKALIESFGLPWTDIEGKPRATTPDIGAYEYSK